MIQIQKSMQRGKADHGWLKSFHTFSFANYYNEKMMSFSSLRVINEDWIGANSGFPSHGHKDMEIITYVIEGAIEHKDSMGNSTIIKPGEVQRMSAGTGVNHSEFNPSRDSITHLLQIWILPKQAMLTPQYQQLHFSSDEKLNNLKLIVSGEDKSDDIKIAQDVNLYASVLQKDHQLVFNFDDKKFTYLNLIKGEIKVNEQKLVSGDAALIESETALNIQGMASSSEFLLFELA